MGNHKVLINWEEVGNLIMAGSSVREIAGYFGISERVIYARCEVDLNKPYCEYKQEKRAKGDSILRAHQYAKALGKTDKGDNTLLIWLGKQRLDQRDKPKEEEDSSSKELANAIIKLSKGEKDE